LHKHFIAKKLIKLLMHIFALENLYEILFYSQSISTGKVFYLLFNFTRLLCQGLTLYLLRTIKTNKFVTKKII